MLVSDILIVLFFSFISCPTLIFIITGDKLWTLPSAPSTDSVFNRPSPNLVKTVVVCFLFLISLCNNVLSMHCSIVGSRTKLFAVCAPRMNSNFDVFFFVILRLKSYRLMSNKNDKCVVKLAMLCLKSTTENAYIGNFCFTTKFGRIQLSRQTKQLKHTT